MKYITCATKNVELFGKRQSSSFLTLSDMSSSPPRYPTLCNSPNGYANHTNNPVTSFTPISDLPHFSTTFSRLVVKVFSWSSTRRENFEKTISARRWENFRTAWARIQQIPRVEEGRRARQRKVVTRKVCTRCLNTRKSLILCLGPSDISKIIKMIMLKNYNPVIVFSFSKRDCEGLALTLSKFEFNSTEDQDMVSSIFNNAIDNLSQDDRQLPQITNLLPLLRRGIGIHHGGLLPILKEVIEILFQEGLIKVLFATETFSIGLNMPAKTVVFTAARKFDGREFRNISSGEYIQMSGRAGRRGLDDRGVVIMMCDEKLEPTSAKEMVKGEADRLDSAFHLGYNMILNLMKVEGISPEYMLERCFFQFQSSAGIPALEDGTRT